MPGQRELLDTEAKLAVTGALAAAEGKALFFKLGILQHKKPWESRDPQ